MDVVGEASDGAEAVVSAERAHPDVVVMDMRMPNVDGIEATEQIAAAEWAMPSVVLSASAEPQMIEAALNAGAASCLKKGVGLDELIDAIRAAHNARERVHIAQVNGARALDPLDSPALADFVAALAPVNALADAAPGFVWRLQTEDGDATAVRVDDDPRVIVNLSVWASLEALWAFVYGSAH